MEERIGQRNGNHKSRERNGKKSTQETRIMKKGWGKE